MKISKKKLCELQCRLGLTGVQIAGKAGIKPQSYSAIKTRGTCSAPTIGKIAGALGVDVAELIDSED